MFKLLKNKKGVSKMLEMLMITPIAIYIILFSLFKIINFINFNSLNEETQDYTRSIITCENLESALNVLAEKNYNSKTEIVKIEITNSYSDDESKVELNFGSTTTTSLFKTFINPDGKSFNIANYNLTNIDFKEIQNNWKIGNIITVYTFHDYYKSTFGKMGDVFVVNVNGKKENISFGIETSLTTSSKQVIANE